MNDQNKSLLEMMQVGNRLFGDNYHFWLETEYGMPTGYHVEEQDVRNLLRDGKIQCVGGGNKDFYKVTD